MKAIVLRGKGTSEIEERPIPEIGPDEMLVRVRVCGVCTAESPGWREGVARANGVLGHEPVGDVEKVGANVKGFSPGDRVTGYLLRPRTPPLAKSPAVLCLHQTQITRIGSGEPAGVGGKPNLQGEELAVRLLDAAKRNSRRQGVRYAREIGRNCSHGCCSRTVWQGACRARTVPLPIQKWAYVRVTALWGVHLTRIHANVCMAKDLCRTSLVSPSGLAAKAAPELRELGLRECPTPLI